MLQRKCRLLFFEIMVLVLTGVVMVASSSYLWATMKYNDPYHFISCQILFAIQVLINLGVVVGLFPVTGVYTSIFVLWWF